MMASVVTRIEELGFEERHIYPWWLYFPLPASGCWFNKPFKDHVRQQWLSWMIAECVIHGTTSPPLWCNVADLVNCMMAEMKGKERIILNAWLKTGYKLFPKEAGGKIM
jgi:hypothetical protein